MIYSNRQHSQDYMGISPRLDCALTYLQTHDLSGMEPGRYPIQGDDVWLRLSDNRTKPENEAVYEAHDQFIDIQMILQGQEIIRCAFRREMARVIESHPERDITFYEGSGQPLLLSAGEYLILFPEDAHAPSICVDAPATVRKALFKVRI